MGSWNEILEEISNHNSPFDTVRRKYLKALHEKEGRNVVAYYSGWLQPKSDAQYAINDDDKNGLMACLCGIDRTKGLDLILHSPGGNVAATESLIEYLREMFGSDIRTIVPQISMSGGTMLACTGKTVLMGRHSNLGPIDPQFGGVPARELLREFERAREEIKASPSSAQLWAQIISKYHPTLLQQAEHALDWSEEIAISALKSGMFEGDAEADDKAKRLAHYLLADDHHAHERHIDRKQLKAHGMQISDLEEDQELQDIVLSIHHSFMITFGSTTAFKIVENHKGVAMIRASNNSGQERKAPPIPQAQNDATPRRSDKIVKVPGFWSRLKAALKFIFSPNMQ